jgi:hypothetical protein
VRAHQQRSIGTVAPKALAAACVLVAAVACLFAVAGCTSGPAPVPPVSTPTGVGSYSARADGSVEATGYVVREDLEGGFWALQDIAPTPSSVVQPKILAVLLPGSVDEKGIAALVGSYVRVGGRLAGDVSVRMAGPEVLVDAIDLVAVPAP